MPVGALDAWARASEEERRGWIGDGEYFGPFELGGTHAFYLKRVGSALRPLVALRAGTYFAVIVSAETDEDIRFAFDEPEETWPLVEAARLSGPLVLFHVDTPVIASHDGEPARVDGEHESYDLSAGTYDVEGRTSGLAAVISFQRVGD
jgi:hypothetical protein